MPPPAFTPEQQEILKALSADARVYADEKRIEAERALRIKIQALADVLIASGLATAEAIEAAEQVRTAETAVDLPLQPNIQAAEAEVRRALGQQAGTDEETR